MRVNYIVETSVKCEKPKYITVSNYHAINQVVMRMHKHNHRIDEAIGKWIIKYKNQ